MSNRIGQLRNAIEMIHRCKAVRADSEVVVEPFRGEAVWDDVVETFDITGHSKAKQCHAWSYKEKDGTQTVTVLESPPVNSPETTAKMAIAAAAIGNN